MTITADTLVPEQLWQAIQPLLPPPPPRRYGGRPRVDDRACLAGIVYQLRTGVPRRLLPTRQLGCGSPVTCWRRLRDWQRAGVWQQLHHHLLNQLGREGQAPSTTCWSTAVASTRASALAATGMWWSGRWPGWPATGGCRSATSGAPTSC